MRRRATMMLSVFSKEEEGQGEARVRVVGKKSWKEKSREKFLTQRVVGWEEKKLIEEEEEEEEEEVVEVVKGGGDREE